MEVNMVLVWKSALCYKKKKNSKKKQKKNTFTQQVINHVNDVKVWPCTVSLWVMDDWQLMITWAEGWL